MSSVRSVITSPQLRWAVGGWTAFIAENLILSENRSFLISTFGEDGYRGLYGTFSTAAVGSIVYGYFFRVRNVGPFLWSLQAGEGPSVAARFTSFAVKSLGLGLVSQTFPKLQIPVYFGAEYDEEVAIQQQQAGADSDAPTRTWKIRCPFDFTDAKQWQQQDESQEKLSVHGVDRVSRHAGLWSLGLVGVGSALLTPSVPTRAWFCMPILVAWIGGAHTDSRHRRGLGGDLPSDVDAATSNVPFAAMITGKQEEGNVVSTFTELAKEIRPLNALVATTVAALWVGSRGRSRLPRVAIAK